MRDWTMGLADEGGRRRVGRPRWCSAPLRRPGQRTVSATTAGCSRRRAAAYASNDHSDRELIKEWEASPDKGYPTLSPSNIIPMKAAIIRYTAIVAKGGWRSLPDVKLERGTSHPAVALLRERLAMSGDLKDAGSSGSFDYYRGEGRQALSGLQRPRPYRHRWTRARSRR